MEHVYVGFVWWFYVWGDGFLYELSLLKIIFSVEMFVWGLYDGFYVFDAFKNYF